MYRARELQVHVRVRAHEVTFVLHPPLQLHYDRLPGELIQERLGIHGHGRGHGDRRRA